MFLNILTAVYIITIILFMIGIMGMATRMIVLHNREWKRIQQRMRELE